MSPTEMRDHGFAVVSEAISPAVIRELDAVLDALLQPPGGDDCFGQDLSRLKYDLDLDSQLVLGRVLTPALRQVLSALAERELCLAQVIGFEIKAGESRGFSWHVGHGSFAYQRIEDFGATLWIPLSPVDPDGQKGGVACVPRSRLSGDFLYQLHRSAVEYLAATRMGQQGDPEARSRSLQDYTHLTALVPYQDLLEHYAVEPAFSPGDALFFDKYVLHRTSPLLSGPLARRRALVLRFVDTGSRFSQAGALLHSLITHAVKAESASTLPARMGLQDGELLITSPVFSGLRQRILRPGCVAR